MCQACMCILLFKNSHISCVKPFIFNHIEDEVFHLPFFYVAGLLAHESCIDLLTIHPKHQVSLDNSLLQIMIICN